MANMKIIIAGGRDFNDYAKLESSMFDCFDGDSVHIISGNARGADRLGEAWARARNIPVTIMPAEWDKYGKSAGYRRNQDMAKKADAVIAFWDGASRGTKHMIDIAKAQGLRLHIITY